jgi:hypothetical protein
MDEIVRLLTEKNECLGKFYELNASELKAIATGNFENLERFYAAREGLLGIIEKVDEIVEKKASEIEPGTSLANQRMEMESALSLKNDWVTKILNQDLEILSAIDSAKSNLIKEITEVQSTKKAMGAYKSGKKVQRLDEEV